MKVIRDINEFKPEGPVFLTQGTFDGLHLGHNEILTRLVKAAKKDNGVSVLLTFWPHPRLVLFPTDNDLKMINTLEEKIELMAELGIDYFIILPFTKELSRTPAAKFTREVLVNKLKVHKLIIGYDHRFGKNREGSLSQMIRLSKRFGFMVEEIPAQDINESIVSSTKIRHAIEAGEIHLANQLLGHSFSVRGKVVHGNERGRKLGYPTANIFVEDSVKIIPKTGVYAVNVTVKQESYGGMLNIGYNPTFMNNELRLEVHIFDFSNRIYDEVITLNFVKRVRDEMRFESAKALEEQLKLDEKEIRKILDK